LTSKGEPHPGRRKPMTTAVTEPKKTVDEETLKREAEVCGDQE